MALAKKGLRTIQVDGESFVWRVRRRVSHEEKHEAQLNIPIQHVCGGQLFIAHLGYSRSGYEAYGIAGAGSMKEITPAMIEACIIKAIGLGWQYKCSGKPVSVIDGKLTDNTIVARWLSSSTNG
jgi:hypothetical protein